VISRERPEDLLGSLYAGAIYLLAASEASRLLVARTEALLVEAFESDDPRARAATLANDDVFARVGAIRRRLFLSDDVDELLREVVRAQGLDPDELALDPPRLRAILPRGHENPAARAVYYVHRDTWYGHPPSLVTWWVPLDDLPADETFVFYPELFARPVVNDSEVFDYDAWTRRGLDLRIGWQDREAGLRESYPAVNATLPETPSLGFSCRRGENLVFSGAQLHRTLPQDKGRARFSVDFRLVRLADHERGRGAPSVDARARGSALRDYRMPRRRAPVLERLREIAREHGDAPALEDTDGRPTSFRELPVRVDERAAELREVGEGDLVLVRREKSSALVLDLLAIWRRGAAFLLVDPATPAPRADAIERESGARWRIDPDGLPVGRASRPPASEGGKLAYVVFTSGSTGTPKGVRVSHDGLVPMLEAQVRAFELAPGSRALAYLSPSFDAFLSDVFATLLGGATLVFERTSRLASVRGLVETLAERSITHLDLPPSLLPAIEVASLPPCLRVVVLGGEPASIPHVRALARRVRVVNVYGPTEATICTSLCSVDPERWDRPLLGDPLPGVEYRLEEEELLIASAGLALGYVGRDDETARAFVHRDGKRFYRTGDRVRRTDEGGYEFLGRLDRQVKVRGVRVELGEVEATLLRDARIREAAVLAREGGLVAFVVRARAVIAQELRESLRAFLPAAALPRIVFLDALPRLESRKTDLSQLASWPLETSVPDEEKPRGPRERLLASLVARVLGREIGRTASFTDEGDSFAVVELAALAESAGFVFAPCAIAETPTIAALAGRASEPALMDASCALSEGERAWAEVGGVPGGVGVSPALGGRAGRPPHRESRESAGSGQVLVTGITGFLGARVAREWLERNEGLLHALVRAPDERIARQRVARALGTDLERVRVHVGSCAAPSLGLDEARWNELADSVDVVLHAAGRVDATASFAALRGANLASAAQIARFTLSGRPKRLVHASSLAPFVCAESPPAFVREDDLAPAGRIAGAYALSKLAAEHLLRASGADARIVRFGLLAGSTEDGRSHERCQLVLFLRGLAAIGAAPLVEAKLELDVTPIDHAARAFVLLARAPAGTFHVASREPATLEALVQALEDAGVHLLRVPPEELFERVARAAATRGEIGTAALGLVRRLRPGARHALETDLFLATGTRFETARAERFAGPGPLPDRTLLARLARAALAGDRP
jgi:amino acid adenylation domain-containing protein/thioester reductase-like protein